MTPRSAPSLIAALLASLLLALTPASEAQKKRATRRGSALPVSPTEAGLTGGIVALKTPPASEIRFAAGEFVMGSTIDEIARALGLCKRESGGNLCGLPVARESLYHDSDNLITPEDLLQNEMEPHKVTLSAFWIDQREVSVADYQRCVDAGPCTKPPFAAGAVRFERPGYPVSHVTWEDARVYCQWRGKRLPTEAEWERAARGTRGRQFPWGNEYNRRTSNHGMLSATYAQMRRKSVRDRVTTIEPDGRDGFVELAPVGSFPDGRTPEGLEDMAGNVSEWVLDSYEPRYAEASATNPQGPSTGRQSFRVIRGGSYLHAAPWLRAPARLMAPPEERQSWIGFRCAR